jgi:hypothetical protein
MTVSGWRLWADNRPSDKIFPIHNVAPEYVDCGEESEQWG